MKEKNIPIIIFLIILVSVLITFIYFNQSNADENQYDGNIETISDEEVVNEIDNIFIDEDDEVEIGDMV
jgi:hypothetical protein